MTELRPAPQWLVTNLVSILGYQTALTTAEAELDQQIRDNDGVVPQKAGRLVALIAALKAMGGEPASQGVPQA